MISNIDIVKLLLVKDEQIDITGLCFITINFFQVYINTKMLYVLTGSEGIHHGGGRRISRNGGIVETGGSSRNGRITTLCPL